MQVQVAVLTARIAYMTKHMQENKKDYASLRGLTAMVRPPLAPATNTRSARHHHP